MYANKFALYDTALAARSSLLLPFSFIVTDRRAFVFCRRLLGFSRANLHTLPLANKSTVAHMTK